MGFARTDTEMANRPDEYLKGFTEFSEFLGSSADLVVFRRFDVISCRNLLYLQAELIALEDRLQELDKQDNVDTRTHKHMENALASRDWSTFVRLSQSENHPRQKEKMRVVREVRTVLHEYHDSLDRYKRVLSLDNPSDHTPNLINRFFVDKRIFTSPGDRIFDNPRDVISLRHNPDQDRFSRWVQATFGHLFSDRRPVPKSWKDFYYLEENGGIARLISILSVLLATLLLFGAIVALNFVSTKNRGARLGIIGAFTTAFAITIGIFTNAKRGELFTAVATYSAVLVVFATVNIDS